MTEESSWDEIYKNWESYPNCKVRIEGSIPEGMWGKELPNGLIGINNNPLANEWLWQDIVRTRRLEDTEESVKEQLVHRRWQLQIFYGYVAAEGSEEKPQRRRILDLLEPLGHPGFWSSGVGTLLIADEIEYGAAVKKVHALLEAHGVTPRVLEEFEEDE